MRAKEQEQDTEGLAFAALIALSGLIVATSLAVVLIALDQVAWMDSRLEEFHRVIDHAQRLP